MKKLKFLLPALAVFLTGCSSDDPTPGIGTGDDENAKFISVNISSTGSGTTTRADAATGGTTDTSTGTSWGNSGFDNGTDAENKAETVLFVFYKSSDNGITGVQTQTPQLVTLTSEDLAAGNDASPQSGRISKTVVAIAGKEEPSHMLVVLNASDEIRNELNGKNLKEAYEMIGSYGKNGNYYIMTNSSYAAEDGRTIIKATEIGEGQIHDSKAKAEASTNPVEVFVERVVAKVKATKADNWKVESSEIDTDNTTGGIEKFTLTPTVLGIEIANVPRTAYLFKNIQNIYTNMYLWPGINDLPNKRSYWATTVASRGDDKFVNRSWETLKGEGYVFDSKEYYILPNTTTDHLTSVLVTAQLNGSDGKPVSLVYWGGSYYLKENFKNQIASFLNNGGYWIKEGNTYRNFKKEDVGYVENAEHETLVTAGTIKAYQTIGKVLTNSDGTKKYDIFKKVDENNYQEAQPDDIKKYLSDPHNVFEYWNDGKCYYFTEIEHYPNPTTAAEGSADRYKFRYGVIRNHVYKLELESLHGLGVPVVNPEEIIIPERPGDHAWYVGAKIHVLKWRVVPTQHVNFGK